MIPRKYNVETPVYTHYGKETRAYRTALRLMQEHVKSPEHDVHGEHTVDAKGRQWFKLSIVRKGLEK